MFEGKFWRRALGYPSAERLTPLITVGVEIQQLSHLCGFNSDVLIIKGLAIFSIFISFIFMNLI